MGFRTFKAALSGIVACLSVFASPALADSVAELDVLSQASSDVVSGMALARKEIRADDLLGAMATLERLLINHPEADDALLLHASLLCRLDDRAGSLIEFDHLRGHDIPDQAWNEATAPCAAISGSARSGG